MREDQAKFQSAPGLEAGRCIARRLTWVPSRSFQSAPGLEAGRCAAVAARAAQADAVSIRARP